MFSQFSNNLFNPPENTLMSEKDEYLGDELSFEHRPMRRFTSSEPAPCFKNLNFANYYFQDAKEVRPFDLPLNSYTPEMLPA
jgi:hypothetical protein